MIIEFEDNYNEVVILVADDDDTVMVQPVVTRTSNENSSINIQNFVSITGQTQFVIEGAPTSLKMVFMSRTLALEGPTLDYEYSNGLLVFNEVILEGSKIKVIY